MQAILKTLLALGAVAAVQAAPVTFTDIVNPAADIRIYDGGPVYTFTHNITDNGFNNTTDDISSADIYINLKDDDQDFLFFNLETVRIRLDNVTQGSAFEVSTQTYHFDVMTQFLQTDGNLVVRLEARHGDFLFLDSRLVVNADRTLPSAPEAVPEPTTWAMMGLGLLGLGFASRRRKA